MKAVDVIKARAQMRDFLFDPNYKSDEERIHHGLERMTLSIGCCAQQIENVEAFAVNMTAALVTVDPESMAQNFYVDAGIGPAIDAVTNALPEEFPNADIQPPCSTGFAVLGQPWRWENAYGREQTATVVTWAPAKLPERDDILFWAVGLWTNVLDEEVRELLSGWDYKTRSSWQRITRGWYLARVVAIFINLPVGPLEWDVTDPQARADANMAPLTEPERELLINDRIPNMDRRVLALWAALAGADTPGMNREVEKVVELPGKSLEKTARKRSVPGAVSYIYAGQHRTPTPPENVGSRGPVSVYYWRNGFSKRVVLDDGSVVIRKRRGTWCGDPSKPVSERSKVRIAKGTITRPSDFIPEEVNA